MKKRIVLSGLLAAALTLSLSACGGDQDAGGDPGAHPYPDIHAGAHPHSHAGAPAAPKWGDQVFAKTFTSGDGATVLTASFTLPLIQNTDGLPRRGGHQRVVQGRGGQPDAGGRGGL